MTEDFAPPDWNAPIDLPGLLAATPADGLIRGVHFQQIEDELRAAGASSGGSKEYSALKNYPMRDYIGFVHRAAQQLCPELPVRQGIRQIGEGVYTSFTSTLVGKAIFSIAGHRFRTVAKLAPTGYATCYSPGVVEVEGMGKGNLEVRLREIWPFADSMQVGVWEGLMQVCGVVGRVWVRRLSACDVDFEVQWDE